MLTKAQIRELIELTRQETVVEPSAAFPFRVTRQAMGHHPDPARARLQGALSIMLEAASSRETRDALEEPTNQCKPGCTSRSLVCIDPARGLHRCLQCGSTFED